MVVLSGSYRGNLGCEVVHEPSGARIVTDAPADHAGRGAAFSPTDLVAAGLAACVTTVVAIVAERHGIDVSGMRFRIEKHMVSDPRRRIGRLDLTVWLPARLDERERATLERAGRTCPVHHSLSSEVATEIRYVYE